MHRWPENPDDHVDPALAPLTEAREGESEGFDVADRAETPRRSRDRGP